MKSRMLAIIGVVCVAISSIKVRGVELDDNAEYFSKQNNNVDTINLYDSYDYPVDLYDDEWYEFKSVVEMREVTQLPQDVKMNISTEALLELILSYPLLCDINAFETLNEGYMHLKEQFNGIEEMLSRQDAFEVIINRYDNYEILENKKSTSEILKGCYSVQEISRLSEKERKRAVIYDNAKVKNAISIMECMLLELTKSGDEEKFMGVYVKKIKEKQRSEYYENENLAILVTENMNAPVFASYAEQTSLEVTSSSSSFYTTLYTPNDRTPVSVLYTSTLTMCNVSSFEDLIEAYAATIVTSASVTFNCHSFAWLDTLDYSTYQHMWLNNPDAFAEDSYFEESSIAKVGDISYWGAHSCIVKRVNVDDPNDSINEPTNYCLSKWADGPMVMHYEKRCPYYNNQTIYYYRKAQ